MSTLYNFNAGPSVLPKEVFQQASEAVINYNNIGLSILEIGHRTAEFISIMEEARALVKELMQLDDDHEVLFLHGGATTQFMQVPMNLLDPKDCAAYADTGVWSGKAIKEARLFGKVEIVCSSKDKNYSYIPDDFAVPNDARYLHITTNNTIYGTQWQKIPSTSIPVVADMSSDILSRSMNFNSFDLIYAGAQKNIGTAGTTLVVVRKGFLGRIRRPIPAIMDYRNHIRDNSLLNTPPVFAVYVSLLNLRWLKSIGGVGEVEKLNTEKSNLLYKEINENDLFTPAAEPGSRSKMNVCFFLKDASLEEPFISFCALRGIVGIKGHRSSGGLRASLYNALPLSAVEHLIEAMQAFRNSLQ